MNPVSSPPPLRPVAPSRLDWIVAALLLSLVAALSLFPVRNNDIWWLMAVGRRMVETRAFFTTDPFTFTSPGAPWAPQAFLPAIVLYCVHHAASYYGLIALRVLLVTGTFAVTLSTLARIGVRWWSAAPVVAVAILNAHSRFIIRAHLFEYLFLALLVGFLLTSHRRKGWRFFALPVALQVLWTNSHPSYLLGPALTALFFAAEWMGGVLSTRTSRVGSCGGPVDARRAAALVALMLGACLANPAPGLFLSQPLSGEQRELVSRFTLEWRSPFDPALRHGAFHPYYEIYLATASVSLVLGALGRLRLGPAAVLVATGALSLFAHRFRVEFVVAGLPAVFALALAGPVPIARNLSGGLMAAIRGRPGGVGSGRNPATATRRIALSAAGLAAAVLAVVMIARVEVSGGVADRYPTRALAFVAEHRIARRSFHTIGFGSYLVWSLYGERRSFIDGRNFNAGVYRDFLAAQSGALESVAEKYRIDAFILPPVEKSDAGILRIHRDLAASKRWRLVFLDRIAWIYVRADAVGAPWMAAHGFTEYHPLRLGGRKRTGTQMRAMAAELERAVAQSPGYFRTWRDLALTRAALGNTEAARPALDRALELAPGDNVSRDLDRQLHSGG